MHLRVASGQYVVAEGGGGGAVNADRWVTGSWETFTLEDLNGGVLQDGDPVAFRTSAGYYLQAVSGGGGAMLAPAQSVGAWETFTILNLAQVGAPIENGTSIGLLSSGSYYACAENGGGSVVNVNRSVVGAWETFVLEVASSPAVAAVADESPTHPVTGPWVEEGGGPTSGATAFTVAPFSRGAPSSSPSPVTEIVEYYHVDALGSVRVVTDGAGQVLRRHDFLPFGEEWQPPMASPDQRLFTGKERDVETGLDYFGARYYRADLGRFTTADPIGVTAKRMVDPQRLNRYTYVRNRPMVFVDPDGRYEGWMHEVISATLLRMAGVSAAAVSEIARATGAGPGGADSREFMAPWPPNWFNGRATGLHFPSRGQIAGDLAGLAGNIDARRYPRAGHSMHAVQDGLGSHAAFAGKGVLGMIGHLFQSFASLLGLAQNPDTVVGDAKFIWMANELYRSLTEDPTAELTPEQIQELIQALVTRAGELGKKIVVKQRQGDGK